MIKVKNVPAIAAVLPSKVLWPQWIGGIGATLMMLVNGLCGGWSSPYLALLLSDDSPMFITASEASWIASLMNVGRLVGGIMAAFSIEYLGSGKTMFLIGFPTGLGWICAILANHVAWLYAARVLGGISVGMAFGTFPIHIGSIADPSIRGALVSLALSGAAMGNLLGSLIGTNLSMAYFSMIALILTVSYVIVYTVVPDSPHHLLRVGKIEEAEKAVGWYNRSVEVKKELESIKQYIFASSSTTIGDRLREFNLPHNRRAGVIIIVLFTFMQLSGMNSLIFYMEIILVRAKVTCLAPSSVVIASGVVAIVTGWMSVYLIERTGRKLLLIISSVGIFLSMGGMGLHFTLLKYWPDLPANDWMAISSLMMWQTSYNLGVFVVPSAVLSELFPSNLTTLAACAASITSGIIAFVSTKSYQPMVDAVGEQYVMWFYGCIAILAVPFAVFCMPETKGKSLQEIQNILVNGSNCSKEKDTETGRI